MKAECCTFETHTRVHCQGKIAACKFWEHVDGSAILPCDKILRGIGVISQKAW